MISVFGITSNILNVIVLSRKNMVSPTNAIFIGLVVADMFSIISFMPYNYHYHIRNYANVKEKFSYGWVFYEPFHFHFTVTVHTANVG